MTARNATERESSGEGGFVPGGAFARLSVPSPASAIPNDSPCAMNQTRSPGSTPASYEGRPAGGGPEEPRNGLPLYLRIGSRHKFIEVIDAPTNTRRYRVTDRNIIVISSGPYGHPAGATGVHARRTPFLP